MFPPTYKVFTNPDKTKTRLRHSIKDSQCSFAIIGKTPEELEAKFNLLKTQKSNIQPLLLVIGDVLDIKRISVYFDGIRYPILKSLTAIDILIKLMFVFNIEYPVESNIFYMFIQKFFYDIPFSSEKEVSTKISTVISALLN